MRKANTAIDFTKDPRSGLYLPNNIRRRKSPIVNSRFLFPRRRAFRILNTSWATWDETTESGWGDSANVFIALFEGAAAGDNETGQGGGLSGADLILTQSGNVPGAVGDPPTRQLTAGSTQYFTHTLTAGGIIASNGGAGWSVIIKVKDFVDSGTDQYLYWYTVNDAGRLRVMLMKVGGSNVLSFDVYDVDAGVWKIALDTANTIPSSGDVYICAWYDGTYFRAGFATSKPNKWTDFSSGSRVSNTDTSSATGPAAGIGASQAGGNPSTVKLYYIILAKKSLIDNNS